MMGKKSCKAGESIHYDIEKFVPNSHLLRKISRIVNFEFVVEITKDKYCPKNGRPSIDPVIFFKMTLVGYLFGIYSDRRLCEEIQLNLAYRWFCGFSLEEKIPDHSSLSKIRQSLGEDMFLRAFHEILKQCKSLGFLRGRKLMADASIFPADAIVTPI